MTLKSGFCATTFMLWLLDRCSAIQQFKDLGVYCTYNMNFNLHITKIVKKSFRILDFTKRVVKPFSDTKVLLTLYNSYIRSRLDYSLPVWSPKPQHLINKIARVQKKFAKHLAFQSVVRYDDFTYLQLCKKFYLSTLKSGSTGFSRDKNI